VDKSLADKLNEDFPELYKGRHKCSMCFGFECGDGWFHLLFDLSRDLMRISQEKNYNIPVAVQVKEKFGGLRFYINESNNDYEDRIRMAEILSVQTCEICGGKGKKRAGGWVQTLCDKHSIIKK